MKKFNTIDKILLGCAVFLIAFTLTMITLFCIYGNVPDVLIDNVFRVLGVEGVLSFAIWWIKKRYARKYEKEDRLQGTFPYDGCGMDAGMGESDEETKGSKEA